MVRIFRRHLLRSEILTFHGQFSVVDLLWGNNANNKKGGKKKKKAPKKPTAQDKIDMLIMGKSIKGKGKIMSTIPPPKDAVERACTMKEELLEQIENIGERLPPNTLDQLIDELGGPENVAEV